MQNENEMMAFVYYRAHNYMSSGTEDDVPNLICHGVTLCQVGVKNDRIINLASKYRLKTHPGSHFFIDLVPLC